MHQARTRSRRLRLIVSVVTIVLVLLAGTASWLAHSHRARAATPPAYSHSWYVNNISNQGNDPPGRCNPQPNYSALYDLGCTDGAWDDSHCTNSLVILDFGQPAFRNNIEGTNHIDGATFYDLGQIVVAAEDYAYGWYHGTGSCPRLRLAVGTNNFNECPNVPGYGETNCDHATWGHDWEHVVSVLDTYLNQQSFRWQITPAAADDMETEWDNPTDAHGGTNGVVDGFNSADTPGYLFYDFGDSTPNGECNRVSTIWQPSDIRYVAWVQTYDFPVPEIYQPPNYFCSGAPDQATLWLNVENAAGYMGMNGAMTECRDGYNFLISESYCTMYPLGEYAPSGSSGAWNDLWNTQTNANYGAAMYYATNINHQGQTG